MFINVLIIYRFRRAKYCNAVDGNRISVRKNQTRRRVSARVRGGKKIKVESDREIREITGGGTRRNRFGACWKMSGR